MRFDYNQYFKILFTASVCIMVSAIVAITIATVVFVKTHKTIQFDSKLMGFIVQIIMLFFLFSIAVFPFKHGFHLVEEKESDKIEYSGVITNITRTYGQNKYFYENKNVFASYVYIDNEQYYIMYIGDLEIGNEVKFEYLPKSKVILTIYPVDE